MKVFRNISVAVMCCIMAFGLAACGAKESECSITLEDGVTMTWVKYEGSQYYKVNLPSEEECYIVLGKYDTETGKLYTEKNHSSDKTGFVTFWVLSPTLDLEGIGATIGGEAMDSEVITDNTLYPMIQTDPTLPNMDGYESFPAVKFTKDNLEFGKNFVINITTLIQT